MVNQYSRTYTIYKYIQKYHAYMTNQYTNYRLPSNSSIRLNIDFLIVYLLRKVQRNSYTQYTSWVSAAMDCQICSVIENSHINLFSARSFCYFMCSKHSDLVD